jgi:hypothetical protein
MEFSFLCWNVKQFRGGADRTRTVTRRIRNLDPDVFGILEFSDRQFFRDLVMHEFTDYDFGVTDSRGEIEVLVGWRTRRFDQATYSQRRDLQVGNVHLRPGGLVNLRVRRAWYHLLFLHLDSGTSSREYSTRLAMYRKIWSLKEALDRAAGGPGRGRLIALGDLNTMGRGGRRPRTAEQEIAKLRRDAQSHGMWLLEKEYDVTWHSSSGNNTSDLDHVLATDNLGFEPLAVTDAGADIPILVDGWVQLQDRRRELRDFVRTISDHSAVYGEVV